MTSIGQPAPDFTLFDSAKNQVSLHSLKGKKVAYAVGTASHTLLLNVLESSNLKMSDIHEYQVADGVEAKLRKQKQFRLIDDRDAPALRILKLHESHR